MPTYTFYDTVTQEQYEEFMSIFELEKTFPDNLLNMLSILIKFSLL